MSEPTLVHDAATITTSGKTRKGEHVLLVWVLVILSSIAVVLATLATRPAIVLIAALAVALVAFLMGRRARADSRNAA